MTETPAHKNPVRPPVTAEGFAGQDDIFFAAVEMTRMPMIVTDPNQPDNPIVFANVAFLELTGYSEAELIGRNCRFLQGPETDRQTVAQVRAAIEKRTDIAVELLNYRKDGSAFWNALFVSPVFDGAGDLLYFFASQLDVSRRRDAEDALRQAQKMEAVGQLTGGIAHDFNNLLTVVMGNIDSALARTDDPALRQRLERALAASRRAETLTGQMLAFARKQRLDGRPANLNQLIGRLREMVDRALGSQIEIETDFAGDLKLAKVDAVQTEVALLNILINARDAMPEGGKVCIRTRNLTVRAGDGGGLKPGDYVQLLIEDDGHGIPKSVIARVTEPFFTTKDVGQGTGMGLAMVYGFMRQSQGRLDIHSEEGRGTTVTLTFPAVTGEVETGAAHRAAADPRGGRETILMVEDNADVMEMGRSILEDYGYTVVSAETARAALDRIEAGQAFDLLFTDIVMPGGMNGVTLANEVRRLRPDVRILLTTGWAGRALDEGDGERSGYDLIGKPYRRLDLARKVRLTLDGASGI